MTGAFYGGAFDNLAGTGGFYTGTGTVTPEPPSGGGGGGLARDSGSWGGPELRTRQQARKKQQEALSKVLRRTLGILTPAEQAEADRLIAIEAERLQAQIEAEQAALWAANEDDEAAVLAAMWMDDELTLSVLAIGTQIIAARLKGTLH